MSFNPTVPYRPSEHGTFELPACELCLREGEPPLSFPSSDWITVPGYHDKVTSTFATSEGDVQSTRTRPLCLEHRFRDPESVITALDEINEIRNFIAEQWKSIRSYTINTLQNDMNSLVKSLWTSGTTDDVYLHSPIDGNLSNKFAGFQQRMRVTRRGETDPLNVTKRLKEQALAAMTNKAEQWEEAYRNLRSAIGDEWPSISVLAKPKMALGVKIPKRSAVISSLDSYVPPNNTRK